MRKFIFITNGYPRCGKDTFAEILNKYIPTKKVSSIDIIKKIAIDCGWNGIKTDKSRKFLSDLKKLTTEFSDLSFDYVNKLIQKFYTEYYYKILLIDIREIDEIKKLINYNTEIKTIFIENNNIEKNISNDSDKQVENYEYDYIIKNNGTLEEFEENIKEFIKEII